MPKEACIVSRVMLSILIPHFHHNGYFKSPLLLLKQHNCDFSETFSLLLQPIAVFILITPIMQCKRGAIRVMLCLSGRRALKEKVTPHPPVRADATSEIFGRDSNYRYWVQELHYSILLN